MAGTTRQLRLGLIGAGRRGQAHLATIAGFPDLFELRAVCDVDEANAREAAMQTGAAPYSDVREFFSREQLDAVLIITPPESHHLMVRVAAQHGVHMLIETPLATTRAMMDAIAESAERAGVTVEVGEQMYRLPQSQLNRRALDAGLIGRVNRVSTWYESIGQQGSYHQMSLIQFYAGAQIEEVQAYSAPFPLDGGPGDEVWTQGLLFFPQGVVGSCTYVSSWVTSYRRGHPRFISVEGTSGFISSGRAGQNTLVRVEDGKQLSYDMQGGLGDGPEGASGWRFDTPTPVAYENPFADRSLSYADAYGPDDVVGRASELVALHHAITTGGQPEYTIARARRDQELSIAITESADRGGARLRVPLGEETQWERRAHEQFRRRWGGDPIRDAEALITRNFTGGTRF